MKIDEDVMMNDWWMVTVRTAFCKDRLQLGMKNVNPSAFHLVLHSLCTIFAK